MFHHHHIFLAIAFILTLQVFYSAIVSPSSPVVAAAATSEMPHEDPYYMKYRHLIDSDDNNVVVLKPSHRSSQTTPQWRQALEQSLYGISHSPLAGNQDTQNQNMDLQTTSQLSSEQYESVAHNTEWIPETDYLLKIPSPPTKEQQRTVMKNLFFCADACGENNVQDDADLEILCNSACSMEAHCLSTCNYIMRYEMISLCDDFCQMGALYQ